VVGGWDPSARKFFKTDELSFTVPWDLFCQMLEQYQESFLKTSTWQNVHKKINKSKKAWNELPPE
jgi:predicted HAD superfamily hydrolase